ncbi:uncharacterized protein [Lolium perenne]|uniref:uncharacterized protein n=1 Tax=Lolium perenne TaxID=4522 RepID=UPI0021EA1F2D|nr:uncharacterized protein LOC127327909 [Lolium perenne]
MAMAMAAARKATSSATARSAASRFVQTRPRSSSVGEEEKLAREAVGREIQQKKEELYDVIAKAEQSFGTSNFQNLRLLQHLSVQANPRPWDWEWRHLRFSRRVNSVLEMAGFVSLGCMVSHWSKKYKQLREAREELRGLEEELRVLKEEHEAGEWHRPMSNQD